jgi:hypothetical protein
MPAHGSMFGAQNVFHYSASSTSSQNIFSKCGSPNYRGDFIVVIDPGVIMGRAGTSGVTLDMGTGWVAGSTVKLIIQGSLVSAGGAGGAGGGLNSGGQAGLRAGNVLDLRYPITIEMGPSGFLSCGGGGGHGGAGSTAEFGPFPTSWGGGGGGGQGYVGGNGAGDGTGATAGTYNAPGQGGMPGGDVPGDLGYGGSVWADQGFGTSGTAWTVNTRGNAITWIGKTSSNVKGPII